MQEPTDEEVRTSKLDNLKVCTKKEVLSGFWNETKGTLTLASGLVRALNVFITFDYKVPFYLLSCSHLFSLKINQCRKITLENLGSANILNLNTLPWHYKVPFTVCLPPSEPPHFVPIQCGKAVACNLSINILNLYTLCVVECPLLTPAKMPNKSTSADWCLLHLCWQRYIGYCSSCLLSYD